MPGTVASLLVLLHDVLLPSEQILSISFIFQIPGHVFERNPWIRGSFRSLADSESFEEGPAPSTSMW